MNGRVIKAIIFDQGGVLLNEGLDALWYGYAKVKGLDRDKVYEAAHDILEWHKFTRGTVTQNQYYDFVSKKLGLAIDPLVVKQQFLNNYTVNKDLLNLIKKLQKRYKIGIVSNFPKEWAQLLDRKHGLFKLFDATSISGYTGFRKPEKEAFDVILKKLKLKPYEYLFIDDRQRYVDVAKKYGIQAIKFESFAQLKRELKKNLI